MAHMRYLFELIPPMRSDVYGFIELISRTGAVGMVNDSSDYRYKGVGGERCERMGHNTRVSRLREEQVISGADEMLTERTIDSALYAPEKPEFIFIAEGPAASMAGTDLDEVCAEVTRRTGIGAAHLRISGHRTCDYGTAETLKAYIEHCAAPEVRRERAVSILGGSEFDIGRENIGDIARLLEAQGFEPVPFKHAASAAKSLVITESGLPAARYLKEKFGIDFIAGLPFGRIGADSVISALRGEEVESTAEQSGGKSALIISEQFTANAIRRTLYGRGFGSVTAASFQAISPMYAQPQDKHLELEKELIDIISAGYDVIIADGIYKACAPEGSYGKWISLPCTAFYCPAESMPRLVSNRLDDFLAPEGI